MGRPTGERWIGAGLCLAGSAASVLALGFFQPAEWATELWPWPDTPLSFLFIAYGAIFLYLLTLAGDPEQPALGWDLVAFGLACLSSLAAFAWSRRLLWRDRRGVPPLYLFLSDATRPR